MKTEEEKKSKEVEENLAKYCFHAGRCYEMFLNSLDEARLTIRDVRTRRIHEKAFLKVLDSVERRVKVDLQKLRNYTIA